ncbi:hypothetical protein, partial [Salmonella enterica]|uniref:hypothetical protein n=1 Tax=Salmonella enterica TaxID=28901 RepID=UPI0022B739B9
CYTCGTGIMCDMVYCVFPNANFAGNFAIPTHTVVVSGFFLTATAGDYIQDTVIRLLPDSTC